MCRPSWPKAFRLSRPRSPASPELVPEPATALSLALAWIQDLSVEALDRVTFYSDEAPQAVPAKKPRPRLHFSRADMEAPALPSGTAAAEPAPKPKKPSVAGLAAQMETLMGILPGLSARIDGMDQRTLEIANLVTTGAAAPLRRPLAEGLGATTKAQPPTLAMLGPPPAARASAQRPLTATEDEALEAADVEQDPQPLDVMAQAILAQSKALTSLVQQLASAHADPVLDLGGVGSASARGASQRSSQDVRRARPRPGHFLQGGVAKPRPPDGSLADLEQTFLDGARMEIGFQLTWLEEPPSSLYLPRKNRACKRPRLCPARFPEVDNNSAGLFEGAGHYLGPAPGSTERAGHEGPSAGKCRVAGPKRRPKKKPTPPT